MNRPLKAISVAARIGVSAIALMIAAGTAAQADGMSRSGPASWSGLYIGAQGGWMSADVDTKFLAGTVFDVTADDFGLGGFIGFQRQYGNIVLGVEGGVLFGLGDGEGSVTCPSPLYTCSQSFDGPIYTVGGRLGFPTGAIMPFITLGYAHGSFEHTALDASGIGLGDQPQSGTTDHHGIYMGGGIDMHLRDNLLIGFEYRHYRFRDETTTATIIDGPDVGLPGNSYTTEPSVDTLTLRLTYKFGAREEAVAPLK